MAIRYVSEADAFPAAACTDEATITAFDEVTLEVDEKLDAEVLRIEEQVGLGWRGVRGCGDQDRVNAEARAAMQRWVKDKLFQYRDLDLVRFGNGQGQVRCSSGGGDWGSARWCGCSGSMPCYIEFRKKV